MLKFLVRFPNIMTAEPELAGRGIGREMVEAAEEISLSEGAGALRFDVIDGNFRASRLYEYCGFEFRGCFETFHSFRAYEKILRIK